jgi:hypothetical protein
MHTIFVMLVETNKGERKKDNTQKERNKTKINKKARKSRKRRK